MLNEQHNAIRMSSIILDIGAEVIREHIKHYLKKNGHEDVNELIDSIRDNNTDSQTKNITTPIAKQKMFNGLKKSCFGNIPESLDSFDITKSFALIHNVINELRKESKFKYDSNKYDYCLQLKEIRNRKHAHIRNFKMDDVDFSVTVVTLEEVIRQLCHFNEEISETYLGEVKDELEKDSNQLNIDLVSNLPARPQASQLYKRDNEDEIFEKIAKHKHKLSCIAGMAGVGKSTLAITYGYQRIDNHKAKVNI